MSQSIPALLTARSAWLRGARPAWLAVAIGLFFAGAPLLNLPRFVTDDCYFYLTIARNLALTGQQTFSGVFLTNGFHPLWLYLLAGYDWLIGWLNPEWLYSTYSVVPLTAALLALGMRLNWQIAVRLRVNPLVFTCLPVGFISAFSVLGSEIHLIYVCNAWLLWLLLDDNPNRLHSIKIGLAGALLFLARLDSLFYILPLFAWRIWRQQNFAQAAWMTIAAGLPIGGYLLSNLLIFGQLQPVSGWLKSTFPAIAQGDTYYYQLSTVIRGYNLAFGWLPTLAAAGAALLLARRLSQQSAVFYPMLVGSMLHLGYWVLFSRGATGYLWYYLLPVTTSVLALALLAQNPPRPAIRQAAGLLAGIAVLLLASYLVRSLVRTLPISEVDRMRGYLESQGVAEATVLVGDFPGELAFTTRHRVIALDMLTANPIFVNQMVQAPNGFQYVLDIAAQQGRPVDYILYTGGNWLNFLRANADKSEVEYWFYYPGEPAPRLVGTLQVAPPVYRDQTLTVWKLTPVPISGAKP
jgi:hypothetical protein